MTEIYQRINNLFKKYGVKSVTMDDIARELGISKKTLYSFTRDKIELIEKIVKFDADTREQEFKNELNKEGDAIDQLYRIMRLANKHLMDYSPVLNYDLRKYYPVIFDELRGLSRKSMYTIIIKNITQGKKEGIYRKDLQDELIAKLHLSRLEKLTEEGLITIDEYVSDINFKDIFEYHIRGIANEKGIKILTEKIKTSKKESVKQ